MSDATARCSACGETKPDVDFYAARSRPSGLSGYCRDCAKARARRIYHTRVRNGFCPTCGGEPVVPYARCAACLLYDRRRTGAQPWRAGRQGRPPGSRTGNTSA